MDTGHGPCRICVRLDPYIGSVPDTTCRCIINVHIRVTLRWYHLDGRHCMFPCRRYDWYRYGKWCNGSSWFRCVCGGGGWYWWHRTVFVWLSSRCGSIYRSSRMVGNGMMLWIRPIVVGVGSSGRGTTGTSSSSRGRTKTGSTMIMMILWFGIQQHGLKI